MCVTHSKRKISGVNYDLKYDNMKLILKRISLNFPKKSDSSLEMNIRQEELLFPKKQKIKQKFNRINKQGQIS